MNEEKEYKYKYKETEGLPPYDPDNNSPWIDSRDYWESKFDCQKNRSIELSKSFSELHNHIIEEIVTWLNEHNVKNVDEVQLSASGLIGSIPHKKWCPCTDSVMYMFSASPVTTFVSDEGDEEPTDLCIVDRLTPEFFEI